MLTNNHYERAFSEWLRAWRIPYIAVNEQQRALSQNGTLKSMDFVVSLPGCQLLLDIKGRMSNVTQRRASAENWITQDDVDSLQEWHSAFGSSFKPLLVFTYRQKLALPRLNCSQIFFEDYYYGFYGIELSAYTSEMRSRSRSWQTSSLPRDLFRRLRRPVASFLPRTVFGAQTAGICPQTLT